MNPISDYRKHPNFNLRPDFAEEIGFIDLIRTPLPREVFEEQKRARLSAGRSDVLTYDQHVESRALVPVSRFFGIYGIINPGEKEAAAMISDGVNRRRVDFAGLFESVLASANIAMGIPVDGPSLILPRKQPAVPNAPVTPSHFVYFDSEAGSGEIERMPGVARKLGRGYVLPWEMFSRVSWTMNPFPQG